MPNSSSLPQIILLLVTDQFRYDAFNPVVTPNLYHQLSLATNATKFLNAYVSTPICTPIRAGLLTGKSPWAHGMLGYEFTVNCEEYPTTLPSALKEFAGYQTFGVGKEHFGVNRTTGSYVDQGFDHLKVHDALTHQPYDDDYLEYFHQLHPDIKYPISVSCNAQSHNEWRACAYGLKNESEHPTPWTTRQALRYLEDFDFSDADNNRMFLKVSYHRPHSPYDPPQRLFSKHLARPVPKRIINNTSWDRIFLNTSAMSYDAWYGDPGEADARRSRAGYLASCEFVDEGMGEIFDWMKAHDLFDSSLIAWTTDHGDMQGDHNLFRKGYAYEGSSHVNLVIKPPVVTQEKEATTTQYQENLKEQKTGQQEPRLSDAIVETRDVAVTLYDVAGVLEQVLRRDPMVDGKSLVPILNGNQAKVRTWVDMELFSFQPNQGERDIHWNAIVGIYDYSAYSHPRDQLGCQLWKFIFHVLKGNEQLFCLTNDREEMIDLAKNAEYSEVLEHFRSLMVEQFETEDRGELWVQNGTLVKGRSRIIESPHFACTSHDESLMTAQQ
eukprot:CAMPEP_0194045204 /NCGR_PEP_ID=MMETSP0009_2-20130614/16566_1 /TAXON_ID=210454 /ORGANISM="Grammatophora oceanica, Strain CCMP 410" /LENGTH=551 /DNA_ID=CAMNT_0038689985 /DNA_START=14 /DNA_END=1669 /DNA_ORIENTATION=+